MKYDIYLNKKKMGKSAKRFYSVRGCSGDFKALVRWVNSSVLLKNADFIVNEAGRLDTIKRLSGHDHKGIKAKTVHAFIRGEVIKRGRSVTALLNEFTDITNKKINPCAAYNPFKQGSFFNADSLERIQKEKYVFCTGNAVVCIRDEAIIQQLDFLLS